MEPMDEKRSLINYLNTTKLVLYTVLEFLDCTDLRNLYISLKQAPNSNHGSLVAILQSYLYIRLHMISTDRSYYYFVYGNTRFRNIEKLTIAYLVQSNNKFRKLFWLREERNNYFNRILGSSNCQQITEQINQISNDPEIPMMRLVRETVGIGCSSTFQNYLVSLQEDNCSMTAEEYPNLSEFYQKRTNQSYITQFLKIIHQQGRHDNYEKIKRLRLAAYLIKCDEGNKYELENNQLHNFLVGLFMTADQMVQASAAYVSSIEDPFYRFMQFCLRYAIYRNFIISIQDKFAFVFELYETIYDQTFQNQRAAFPKFTFWRPALSKWLIHMSQFHKECTQTFNLFILKKRHANLQEMIENMQEYSRPPDYSAVRNWINILNEQNFLKVKKSTNKQIFELVEEELAFCINQYNQYQIDMSIDEISVNWCGFSKQPLGLPFAQFQRQVIERNSQFYNQILNTNWQSGTLQKMIQTDFNFVMDNSFYKERIFAKVVQLSRIKFKFATQGKSLDFQYQNLDQRIIESNEKSKRPLQVQNHSFRKLYQILPMQQKQFSRYIQKRSAITMDESDGSCESEGFQAQLSRYDSEQFQTPSMHQIQISDFMQDESNQDQDNLQSCQKKTQISSYLRKQVI